MTLHRKGLLPVVFQHLIARLAYFRTIVLQTGQDGEIALIDHRAAEALHVARAGLLLLRRTTARLLALGHRNAGNGNRHQRECEKKLVHRVPSKIPRRVPVPESAGPNGTDCRIGNATKRGEDLPEALANAAKFTALASRITGPAAQLNDADNHLILQSYSVGFLTPCR